MAMFAPSATTATHGVYQWLLDREERDHDDWQITHGQAAGAVYLRQAGLDALRAGDPVTVSVGELPAWARPPGAPQRPPTYAEARCEHRRTLGRAVTVYADDRVTRGAVGAPLAADYQLL